ncbi:MAG: M48 family metalloprotease [Bacteroidetes bacterium]|jgi:Zn-dependent protease with chaperone function|nr:M48 family metalloprotease [Bacteroidota bacterium]
MDFLERQQRARRTTLRLTVLFGLALVVIIGALYLGGLGVLRLVGAAPASPWWWQPVWLLGSVVSIIVLCGGSAWFMLRRLRQRGGAALASLIGARPIHYAQATPKERELLNVVQEMAIAASLPVPWVYVLDREPGINAFTAGYTADDAILAVTHGALQLLNRDELQGIVAHEFSHILYGDTRLNTWLLGILSGLRLLSSVGAGLLTLPTRLTRDRDAGLGCTLVLGVAFVLLITAMILYLSGAYAASKWTVAWLLLLPIGLIVLVVGGLGYVFGRLIQRAVARQREYLADAAAVRFTRLPSGLARALLKIEKNPSGGRILAPAAAQASHFFIADPHSSLFETPLLATHPPLAARRERLLRRSPDSVETHLRALASASAPADADTVMASVGAPTAEHLDYGHATVERLPSTLYAATSDPVQAAALVYGLLLDDEVTMRTRQAATLEDASPSNVQSALVHLQPLVDALAAEHRLPLLELLVPALRRLTAHDRERLRENVRALALADRTVTLFEFALSELLAYWLRPTGRRGPDEDAPLKDLNVLRPDCGVLLSALVHAGHAAPADARRAFEVGCRYLPVAMEPPTLLPADETSHADVRDAIDRLQHVPLAARAQVLSACVHAVLADGQVAAEEAELLRVVAVLFNCPIPPFLPTVR